MIYKVLSLIFMYVCGYHAVILDCWVLCTIYVHLVALDFFYSIFTPCSSSVQPINLEVIPLSLKSLMVAAGT